MLLDELHRRSSISTAEAAKFLGESDRALVRRMLDDLVPRKGGCTRTNPGAPILRADRRRAEVRADQSSSRELSRRLSRTAARWPKSHEKPADPSEAARAMETVDGPLVGVDSWVAAEVSSALHRDAAL
jgi:hypothetical protein